MKKLFFKTPLKKRSLVVHSIIPPFPTEINRFMCVPQKRQELTAWLTSTPLILFLNIYYLFSVMGLTAPHISFIGGGNR